MRRPLAENGAANTDMGRTMSNGDVIVRTHTHAQTVDPIARGNVGQEIKMRRRIFVRGRNTHQAGDAKAMLVTAGRDEPVRIRRRRAGFLRLFAGIDLQIQIRIAPLRLDFSSQNARKLDPVHGMDRIKQGDRILRLVGLQRADQMNLCIGKSLSERRPFFLRLLHSVFTKDAVSGFKNRNNRIGWKRLADRNECHRGSRPTGIFCSSINPYKDGLKGIMGAGIRSVAHGC